MVIDIVNDYNLTWDEDGVRIRFSGVLTTDVILDAKRDFHGDPRFEVQKYSVWDFNDCTKSNIRSDQLPLLIGYHIGASFTLRSHKMALVAAKKAMKLLCKKFITDSKESGIGWDFAVFNTEEEAVEWGNN